MKEKEVIRNVNAYLLDPDLFLVLTEGYHVDYRYTVFPSACCVISHSDYLLLQSGEFKSIKTIHKISGVETIIPEGFNLYSAVKYEGGLLIRNKQTKSLYLMDNRLKMEQLSLNISFTCEENGVFYSILSNLLRRVYPGLIWQIDLTKVAHFVGIDGASIPNELGGELLSYAHLLFVPLEGGQLLALDSRTGEQVWMLNDEISGRYVVYNNLIYKKNLRFIQEIDALTGKVLRKVNIKTPPLYPDLYPSGPFWVYTDMIILTDILEGKVLLLDRLSLSVIDYIEISCRLANATNILIRDNQRLYVHDLSNALHVFELE